MILHALYNLLWYPALPFALLASNGADAQGSRERLGIAAPRSGSSALRIWAHASSVGEIEAIHSVMMRLMHDAPAATAVITAMTTAGRDVARRRIPKADRASARAARQSLGGARVSCAGCAPTWC